MKFNVAKCKEVKIELSERKHIYYSYHSEDILQESVYERDLDNLVPSLSPEYDMKGIFKVKCLMIIIKIAFKYMDVKIFTKVFTAFIRPK